MYIGRTQKEAGEVFGLKGRGTIENIDQNMQTQFLVIQNAYYKDKKTIEQIKEFNHF